MNPRTAKVIPLAFGIGLCWLAIRGISQVMELRQDLLKLDRKFTEQGNIEMVESYNSIHSELLTSLSNSSLALIMIGLATTFLGIKVLQQKNTAEPAATDNAV